MHGLRLYDVVQIWGVLELFFFFLFLPENRALSQDGPISSHQIHVHEYTDGLYDEELFKENMMEAAQQAAKRIDGTLHCGRPFAAYVAPSDSDWPIKPDLQEKIKQFLDKDSDDHRRATDFEIRPGGPIWDTLCEYYPALSKNMCVTARRVYHSMVEPKVSWSGKYLFASYRNDDNFRGPPIRRYEITPLLDISRLPEFHYMEYEDAVKLADCYSYDERPMWLRVPDVFLPSANIKYALENNPSLKTTLSEMQQLSEVICVSTDEIVNFIDNLERKAAVKEARSAVFDRFEGNLARLYVHELTRVLTHDYNVKVNRNKARKADLILALDEELKKRGIRIDDFMKNYD